MLYVALAALITGPLLAGGNRERDAEPTEPDTAAATEVVPEEELVARVNGHGITRTEFDVLVQSNVEQYERQSNQPFPEEQRMPLQQQVLEGLITRTVLEMEIESLGLSVSQERYERTMAEFKSQFPDENAYRQALAQQGFTEERFENELRRQLSIENLITTQALEGLSLEEAELREFYQDNPEYFQRPEQITARHIILTTQNAEDEAERNVIRARIDDIRERIQAGEDFAEMAREYSEDGSASQGGRLGTFGRGQMVPEFEEVAFSLEVGELSTVVETRFGYHLVQVTEKTPEQTVPFEDARDNIEEFLLEDTRNQVAQEYVMDLRESARVERLITLE